MDVNHSKTLNHCVTPFYSSLPKLWISWKYVFDQPNSDFGRGLISLQFAGRNLWTCCWYSKGQTVLGSVRYRLNGTYQLSIFNLTVGFIWWRGFDIDEWLIIWSDCLCMDQCGWKFGIPSCFYNVCRCFRDWDCFFKSVGGFKFFYEIIWSLISNKLWLSGSCSSMVWCERQWKRC